MNVDIFPRAWKSNLSCGECSLRLNILRKKKMCFFCKNFFCQTCITRREDKKFSCQKCQILTARPLDRNKLLNLRSKDLVNYLTSKHISTNGCVEKEDLVNVLMNAVNNSCFHPLSTTRLECSTSSSSYPNSPRNDVFTSDQTNCRRHISQSVESLNNKDGIRIFGHDSAECDVSSYSEPKVLNEVDHLNSSDANHSSLDNHSEAEQASLTNSEAFSITKNGSDSAQGDNVVPISSSLILSDIKSLSDLDSLSVKQLKELLMRNRTDFKGCVERAELIQKASRLWSDYIIARKDLENLTTDELCKICMDAPIECVLLECGHMATCTSCGKQLCECPICRQFVVRCVRTFKA